MTTKDTKTIEPQPKLIWPYLAWTFGWSWCCWALAILLKNLWPSNPLETILFFIGTFGPMVASIITLKKKSFRAITDFIFSGRKRAWFYFLLYSGTLTAIVALASGGKLIDGALAELPLGIIFVAIMGGGNEEPGWRGFLQPALERKFSFSLATAIVGIVWAIWHVPLWFYDRGQTSFPLFFVSCIVFAIWFAGLYKRTRSVIVCVLFHALINNVPASFTGIGEAMGFGDLSQVNPFFYLGGIAIMALYSIYLWYRTDKEEGAQEVRHF
ncbi:CPBP family intramembrane glutamic endopeptidase [Streptococcus dentasini]